MTEDKGVITETKKKHGRWEPSPEDLMNLTPIKARDLIIECFYHAQKETFLKSKKELGLPADENELKESVKTAVMMAFEEAGGNFHNPAKEELGKVVEILARRAKAWRTPQEIIEHHKAQIQKILGLISSS